MPRIYKKRSMVETQEQKVGQDGVREFDTSGKLPQIKTEAVETNSVEIVQPGQKGKRWMEETAFMNEIVTVIVHPSTDKNAHPFPEVYVNGRVQRFVRGHEQKVRRFFVERLARAKLTTYDNQKTKDVDGEDAYRYPSTTGLLYPFVCIDDTEKGKQWLKKTLAEA